MSLFLELMRDGGPIMWVILFCSVVALFIFLKKVFQFHREEINVGELLRGLFNVLRRDGFVEALTPCGCRRRRAHRRGSRRPAAGPPGRAYGRKASAPRRNRRAAAH